MTELTLPQGVDRTAVERALMHPCYAEWPDEKIVEAQQPEAIANALHDLHREIQRAKIAYLFKEKMGGDEDRMVFAKAKKASTELNFLAECDFVIVFNWTVWRKLTSQQKVALVDHELTHCELDPETGKYQMRKHDVEEFGEIIQRWGLWTQDLMQFRQSMEQYGLFDDNPKVALA